MRLLLFTYYFLMITYTQGNWLRACSPSAGVLHLRSWLSWGLVKGMFLHASYSESTVVIGLQTSLKVIVKVRMTVGSFQPRRVLRDACEVCWSSSTCLLFLLKQERFQFTWNKNSVGLNPEVLNSKWLKIGINKIKF